MNENVSREIQSDQEDVIDLGKLFYKILVRWRWFIISVPPVSGGGTILLFNQYAGV